MCFSIKIPYWKILHFDSWKIVSESRFGCFKGLAHYDRRGRFIGKSVRNLTGELNHYDYGGNCSGYSRKSGLLSITHFNSRGNVNGKTLNLCGILFFHVEAA